MEIRQKRSLHKDWIDRDAYKIVDKLKKEGFISYLVGGCVRDLLAGLPPKDFDIVTNAMPKEVRQSIRNSYVIGKRFRLVLVYRYKKMYEVATFRRNATPEELEDEDIVSKDNIFGSPVEDANRRDFTINAIFYDCVEDEVIDHVDGLNDIDEGLLRMIGDPDERLIEDPIRILRAIRLSHKLRFRINYPLRESIERNAQSLQDTALPRRREDLLKILRLKDPFQALTEACDLGVLAATFPYLDKLWKNDAQREEMRRYLKYTKFVVSKDAEPKEELAFFIYIYLRILGETKAFSKCIKEMKESIHKDFLKEELFLFNAEAEWVQKLFYTIEKLSKLSFFEMKRRTKSHHLNSKYLSLAMKYIKMDYLLPPEEIAAWEKALVCGLEPES